MMVSGRLAKTERGRQQRGFLRSILADPAEYALGLADTLKRLRKGFLRSHR
jgi:hypothetical protein